MRSKEESTNFYFNFLCSIDCICAAKDFCIQKTRLHDFVKISGHKDVLIQQGVRKVLLSAGLLHRYGFSRLEGFAKTKDGWTKTTVGSLVMSFYDRIKAVKVNSKDDRKFHWTLLHGCDTICL